MKRLTACLFALTLGFGPAAAQDADPALGEQLFARYCATCHGASAMGDGPRVNELNPQPPDLTRLTIRHNGVFPVERVVMRIDGRDPLVSHGSSMPVYGELFDEAPWVATKTEAGQPILTSGPVVDLLAWLRKIQVKE
ncbi:c-type cytochrome [Puniceibacterium confluentis]|uniref:c-type cytochrome n=1 Tax=Puniceibacterium confluentis TaxID=1958944 RepID=UPI003561539C